VKGKLKVHRVVCAVDCGHVVNPAILTQQIEGGIVYGLSAALKGAITIDRGRVQQGNFDTYNVVRIDEMPIVEVHVVETDHALGGIVEVRSHPFHPRYATRSLRQRASAFASYPSGNRILLKIARW